MRLAALIEVLRGDTALKKVYLIGQDYSFGQHVQRQAARCCAAQRPDIEIVGDELHPMGRVKDFLPYAVKIKASGAQAVLTGNWGNDLTLLVRAMREVGVGGRFYTFYGNALGAPAAIGEAGVGAVLAVAEWHPNVGRAASDEFHAAFRRRFPEPRDDYVHARMQVMVEMLAAAIERAGSTDATAVARALEGVRFDARTLGGLHAARCARPTTSSAAAGGQRDGPARRARRAHDDEGSGFGFRTVRRFEARARRRELQDAAHRAMRDAIRHLPARTSAKSPMPASAAATCWRSGSARATRSRRRSCARRRRVDRRRRDLLCPQPRPARAARGAGGYTCALHGAVSASASPSRRRASALMLAMQALAGAGDEVVAVVPVWPNLTAQPAILGANVRRVALVPRAARGGSTCDVLLAAITPRHAVLLVNAPNNPTGWTLTRAEQQAILAHCRRTGTWIVADEVYERFCFGQGRAARRASSTSPSRRPPRRRAQLLARAS